MDRMMAFLEQAWRRLVGETDGAPHELRYDFLLPAGAGTAYFNLDDIQIELTGCDAILLDGFETHDASNWSAIVP